MRIDELSRELHAQAAETVAGATVSMADLRARRSRSRRRRAAAGGTLAVALLAVGAGLVQPGPHTGSHQPGPAAKAPAPATQRPEWRAVQCSRPQLGGCAVPATLTLSGDRWDRGGSGGLQPLVAANGLNRELPLSLVPVTRHRLVLVGATGAGPGSRLEVSIGSRPARRLPGGRLTALRIPAAGHSRELVVRETGTPATGEVLTIQEYYLRS